MFIVRATGMQPERAPATIFKDTGMTMLTILGNKEQDFGHIRIANPLGRIPQIDFHAKEAPLIDLINLNEIMLECGTDNLRFRGGETINAQTLLRMMLLLDETEYDVNCSILPATDGIYFQNSDKQNYTKLGVRFVPARNMYQFN